MKLLGVLTLFALGALICAQRHNQNGNEASRAELRRHLFGDYDKVNIPDNVSVKFGLSLIGLDVDEDRGTLETDVWMRILWHDHRLAWDNATNKIDLIRVSPNEIWKPDITLYNRCSAHLEDMSTCSKTNAIIYASGDVLWVPPCHLSSYCNLTLDKHPYGEQICTLKFGSWTYDADLINLQMYDGNKGASMDDFGSTEWKVIDSSAQRNERYYPCCAEAYLDVTYNITFIRADALPKVAPHTCES